MNKGFFSVAIIVFIFIISIFFFTLNSQKEIYFSDSYRQMIFDSEQAYVLINNDFFETCSLDGIKSKYGDCEVINKEINWFDLKVKIFCIKENYSKSFEFKYIFLNNTETGECIDGQLLS